MKVVKLVFWLVACAAFYETVHGPDLDCWLFGHNCVWHAQWVRDRGNRPHRWPPACNSEPSRPAATGCGRTGSG
jgi:hypothetical protein